MKILACELRVVPLFQWHGFVWKFFRSDFISVLDIVAYDLECCAFLANKFVSELFDIALVLLSWEEQLLGLVSTKLVGLAICLIWGWSLFGRHLASFLGRSIKVEVEVFAYILVIYLGDGRFGSKPAGHFVPQNCSKRRRRKVAKFLNLTHLSENLTQAS